ncbi:MAG: LPS export ABC transporter periplasmic protein LptC [Paludibacteraceae bacterium]|nr:LPS export ABC transporter periplasmic protein LptC [Paludibacteraceae bacterium]MBP6284213.1 LPS export ABC transporter periplasmic protein LptC [Paludibacteraceae bacterium]
MKVYSITVVSIATVFLFFLSCTASIQNDAPKIDRELMPVLTSYGVTSVISDSGVTRFRFNTPIWSVYDKVDAPYWDFPKGIHLEQFNLNLDITAEVDADTAVYFTQEQKWTLSGNVKAKNVSGELFESELIYVDQKTEKIYTDKFIKITQKERIITGTGFESNQTLTKYVIKKPQGIFPIEQ